MQIEDKLVRIFQAYNLCDAEWLGQLVLQEFLVKTGQQQEINWNAIANSDLTKAKKRYEDVRKLSAFKDAFDD